PGGGANLKLLSGPPPCSQVPVRSNGGLGRDFAILAGAKAPSEPGVWNCANAGAAVTSPYSRTIATPLLLIFNLPMAPPTILLFTHFQPHNTLIIHVFAIVVAYELDHFVIRHASIRECVGVRLLEHDRVFNRDLVVKNVRCNETHAFDNAH